MRLLLWNTRFGLLCTLVALEWAIGAPGQVAGVMQINVAIPSGIQSGSSVPVVVQVGNTSSQAGVTIAVR
jgi:uncharacterized protein (TIGR03437 family)